MKDKKKTNPFTATEVGTLIEGFKGDFKLFGEKLSALTDKVDLLYKEVANQKEDISTIKTDIRFIKKDLAEIKESIKGQDKRLTALETVK